MVRLSRALQLMKEEPEDSIAFLLDAEEWAREGLPSEEGAALSDALAPPMLTQMGLTPTLLPPFQLEWAEGAMAEWGSGERLSRALQQQERSHARQAVTCLLDLCALYASRLARRKRFLSRVGREDGGEEESEESAEERAIMQRASNFCSQIQASTPPRSVRQPPLLRRSGPRRVSNHCQLPRRVPSHPLEPSLVMEAQRLIAPTPQLLSRVNFFALDISFLGLTMRLPSSSPPTTAAAAARAGMGARLHATGSRANRQSECFSLLEENLSEDSDDECNEEDEDVPWCRISQPSQSPPPLMSHTGKASSRHPTQPNVQSTSQQVGLADWVGAAMRPPTSPLRAGKRPGTAIGGAREPAAHVRGVGGVVVRPPLVSYAANVDRPFNTNPSPSPSGRQGEDERLMAASPLRCHAKRAGMAGMQCSSPPEQDHAGLQECGSPPSAMDRGGHRPATQSNHYPAASSIRLVHSPNDFYCSCTLSEAPAFPSLSSPPSCTTSTKVAACARTAQPGSREYGQADHPKRRTPTGEPSLLRRSVFESEFASPSPSVKHVPKAQSHPYPNPHPREAVGPPPPSDPAVYGLDVQGGDPIRIARHHSLRQGGAGNDCELQPACSTNKRGRSRFVVSDGESDSDPPDRGDSTAAAACIPTPEPIRTPLSRVVPALVHTFKRKDATATEACGG
ncbi:MAG: hypothetical protein SGPRY_009936 [Prymnesium sp.]